MKTLVINKQNTCLAALKYIILMWLSNPLGKVKFNHEISRKRSFLSYKNSMSLIYLSIFIDYLSLLDKKQIHSNIDIFKLLHIAYQLTNLLMPILIVIGIHATNYLVKKIQTDTQLNQNTTNIKYFLYLNFSTLAFIFICHNFFWFKNVNIINSLLIILFIIFVHILNDMYIYFLPEQIKNELGDFYTRLGRRRFPRNTSFNDGDGCDDSSGDCGSAGDCGGDGGGGGGGE